MTLGVAAKGTLLAWDGNDVAELTSISGPSESMDPIDLTSHDSTSAFKEFVAGLRDGGEISIEGNFIKTDANGQITMHTDFQAGTAKTWIIKHPAWVDSTHMYPQVTASGLVTAFELTYPMDDKIGFTATIKVTGKPVLKVTA
ncbi:hypothetical protein ES708_06126 [subsurface metagenome]